MIPRNGNVSYNGNNYLTPDDSIRNGSFNVQTIGDWVSVMEQGTGIRERIFLEIKIFCFSTVSQQTIIEFAPNIRNFSIRYCFASLSENLGIDLDYVPVNVTIKRHNGNESVQATIQYRDTIMQPELSSNDNAFDYGSKLVQQVCQSLIWNQMNAMRCSLTVLSLIHTSAISRAHQLA